MLRFFDHGGRGGDSERTPQVAKIATYFDRGGAGIERPSWKKGEGKWGGHRKPPDVIPPPPGTTRPKRKKSTNSKNQKIHEKTSGASFFMDFLILFEFVDFF